MFDPVRMCAILNDEAVDYVIVGGFASVVHGSPLTTQDIDVVPSRRADNLERLARALRRMNAMIRTDREPVAAPIDGPFLAAMPLMLNLVTDFGDLDLTFAPSGGLGGFDEWKAKALVVEIADGTSVTIAGASDFSVGSRPGGTSQVGRRRAVLGCGSWSSS